MSDRGSGTPEIDASTGLAPGWMGIDTVKLVVPVVQTFSPDALETKLYRTSVDRATGEIVETSHSRETLSLGLDLILKTLNGGLQAQVEFSVPRFLHGHNVHPASTAETLVALHAVYEEIEARVPVTVDIDAAWISRLDLDRDFYAPQMHPHLEALEQGKAPRGNHAMSYRDADHHVVSIVRGTPGRWQVTAYDKAHELAEHRRGHEFGELAEGRLRVEASLRTPVLREAGLRTVADLASTDVGLLARKWFESAGINQSVHSAADIAQRIAEGQARHGAKFESVIGSLLAEGVVGRSLRSANTRGDYRRRARELGLDQASDLLTARSETSRLDFDLGRLIWGQEAIR